MDNMLGLDEQLDMTLLFKKPTRVDRGIGKLNIQATAAYWFLLSKTEK